MLGASDVLICTSPDVNSSELHLPKSCIDELSSLFLDLSLTGSVVRSFYDSDRDCMGTLNERARVNLFDGNNQHVASLPLNLDASKGQATFCVRAGMADIFDGQRWSTTVRTGPGINISILDKGERAGTEISRHTLDHAGSTEDSVNDSDGSTVNTEPTSIAAWNMLQCSGQRMLVVDAPSTTDLMDARMGHVVQHWSGARKVLPEQDGDRLYAIGKSPMRGCKKTLFCIQAYDVRYNPAVMSRSLMRGQYPVQGLQHCGLPGKPLGLSGTGAPGVLLYTYGILASACEPRRMRVYDMRHKCSGADQPSAQLSFSNSNPGQKDAPTPIAATVHAELQDAGVKVVCVATTKRLFVYRLKDILEALDSYELDNYNKVSPADKMVEPCVVHTLIDELAADDKIVGMIASRDRLQLACTETSSVVIDLDRTLLEP